MRPRRPTSLFSLPVLLSFNELAWILIFAMGLLCVRAFLPKGNESQGQFPASGQATNDWRPQLELARQSNEVLRAQCEQITVQIASLKEQLNLKEHQLKQAAEELAKAREIAAREATNQAQTIQRLAAELALAKEEISTLGRTNQALLASLQAKNAEFAAARIQIQDLEVKLAGIRGSISPQLLGLKGALTNVAILLDRSASMNAKMPGKAGDSRWSMALMMVDNWLRFLPVRRCVLITFNDHLRSFPPQGLISLTGTEEGANRTNLIAQLYGLTPEGDTATLSALESAFSYKGTNQVDTIILFTDGAPNPPGGEKSGLNAFSTSMMKDILALCARHPGVPVNTIAIGDYYKRKEFTEFLMELSERTGGAFLGK